MADSSMVDRVADAMMARYPGWMPTEGERERMRRSIENARPLSPTEAVKIGRVLRHSEWWKGRLAHSVE